MRARWLKPEFFNDRKMGALGPIAALVFQSLWCMADDGGTALCNPEIVKGKMFIWWPAVGLPEVSEGLRQLSEARRIKRYSIGDDEYAVILSWDKHQSVHNPSKFRYPRPVVEDTGNTAAAIQQEGGSPQHLDSYTPRHLDTQVTPPLVFGPFVERLLTRVPEPLAWRAEIEGMLAGMPGHYRVSPEQMEMAARDYVANGKVKQANLRQFRRYIESIIHEKPNGKTSGSGSTSRAMKLIGLIRERRNPLHLHMVVPEWQTGLSNSDIQVCKTFGLTRILNDTNEGTMVAQLTKALEESSHG